MHAVFENLAAQLSRELSGLTQENAQSRFNGQPQRWSAQQVVEHLVLTYRATARNLEVHLAKRQVTRRQSRSFAEWIVQIMVLSFGYYPVGVPPFDETLPSGIFPAKSGRELAELLEAELRKLDAVLDRGRRQFELERVAVEPILGPLRIDQWRRLHVVYGSCFVKQLAGLRKRMLHEGIQNDSGAVNLAKELTIPGHSSLT